MLDLPSPIHPRSGPFRRAPQPPRSGAAAAISRIPSAEDAATWSPSGIPFTPRSLGVAAPSAMNRLQQPPPIVGNLTSSGRHPSNSYSSMLEDAAATRAGLVHNQPRHQQPPPVAPLLVRRGICHRPVPQAALPLLLSVTFKQPSPSAAARETAPSGLLLAAHSCSQPLQGSCHLPLAPSRPAGKTLANIPVASSPPALRLDAATTPLSALLCCATTSTAASAAGLFRPDRRCQRALASVAIARATPPPLLQFLLCCPASPEPSQFLAVFLRALDLLQRGPVVTS